MPGYDLHPGVDAAYQFPPEVRAAIVAMTELQTALTQVYDNARNRTNHTGTQLAATISNFTAAVQAIAASETAVGVVERATTAEVQTMTDTTRYISPAGLAAAAVSAGTANRIVRRDAAGRAQVVDPSAAQDIATKNYVDVFAALEGSSTQRDARYGVPANDAARVALANQNIAWYNTTHGWWESYYAVTGLAGLTATGLVAGSASGWYPVATGPRASVVPSGAQQLTTGVTFSTWAALGVGGSWRRGGASFITLVGGALVAQIAGRWRITAYMDVQAGSGAGTLYLIKNGSTALNDILYQDVVTLTASPQKFSMWGENVPLIPNQGVQIYAATIGSANFGAGSNGQSQFSGLLLLEYIGPPLVHV